MLQILQDYCDVRNAITTLAFDMKDPVTLGECVSLDRCVDDGVVSAFSKKIVPAM